MVKRKLGLTDGVPDNDSRWNSLEKNTFKKKRTEYRTQSNFNIKIG